MAQQLPDGHILPSVIPVVVDHPLQEIAVGAGNGLAVADDVLEQDVGGQRFEPRIGRGGDRLPRGQHLLEGWRAGRRAIGELAVYLRQQQGLAQAVDDKIPLFLPRQVADVPTEAIHRQKAPPGVLVIDAFDGTDEFRTGKA